MYDASSPRYPSGRIVTSGSGGAGYIATGINPGTGRISIAINPLQIGNRLEIRPGIRSWSRIVLLLRLVLGLSAEGWRWNCARSSDPQGPCGLVQRTSLCKLAPWSRRVFIAGKHLLPSTLALKEIMAKRSPKPKYCSIAFSFWIRTVNNSKNCVRGTVFGVGMALKGLGARLGRGAHDIDGKFPPCDSPPTREQPPLFGKRWKAGKISVYCDYVESFQLVNIMRQF